MTEKGVWTVDYENNTIKVENKPTVAKLYINDEIQDISFALSGSRLTGKLSNGKDVKVSLGGEFKIHCFIFVDNKLILED